VKDVTEIKHVVTKDERNELKQLSARANQILNQIGKVYVQLQELTRQHSEVEKEFNKKWNKILRARNLDPSKRYNIAPDGTLVEWGDDFSEGTESPKVPRK